MPAQDMTFDAAPVKQDTPVQSSGMTFDSAPVKQDTPAESQNTPAQPGILKRAGQLGSDLIQGIGEGALGTVETVSKGLNKIPGVGEYLAPKEGISSLHSVATPDDTTQQIGSGVEGIGEFLLGDEALKGLSVAERLGLAQKVAKLAESNKRIAQIISTGMHAVRGGTVITGQQMLHGATPTQAAKTGAEAAAAGGATGAVAEGLGAAKDAAKNLLSTKAIQPGLQSGIRSLMNAVAEESGVPKATAQSIRDVVKQTADGVYSKAKGIYADLDEATGGRVQRFTDRLQNIRQKLNELTGTEEDVAKEAQLLKAQKETEDAMEDAFNDAESKGVTREKVDQARETFKKSQALYDLDGQVKKATSGMRPGIGDAKLAAKNPETVDPKKFFDRVNNLYDSGRLQDAVGEQGANDLLQHANDHLIKHKQVLRNQQIAKIGGKAIAYGSALYGAKEGVSHALTAGE